MNIGIRITLFFAKSDSEEIPQYEELPTMADLDGFILTGTPTAVNASLGPSAGNFVWLLTDPAVSTK